MPSPSDKKRIGKAKQIIKRKHAEGASKRSIAKAYGVDRRTIDFVVCPEKLEANLQLRKERGGSAVYYDRDEHRESVKKYRKRLKEIGE